MGEKIQQNLEIYLKKQHILSLNRQPGPQPLTPTTQAARLLRRRSDNIPPNPQLPEEESQATSTWNFMNHVAAEGS